MENQKTGSLLVVNLRGIVNTKSSVRTSLEQMGIVKRFSATVLPDSPQTRGVLNLTKNNVAWCKVDSETLDVLQKMGGHTEGNGNEPTRRVFRLNSPKGGFKRSIRRQYGQGGILGPNPELPKIVSAMTSGK